jgi:4-hydroxybenzoyl-CoA reductase subunit beta
LKRGSKTGAAEGKMSLPDFKYVEPKSIEEACLFLKVHGRESKILGGGTDLLPSMKQRIFKPEYLVNPCRIKDLERIEFDEGGGLRIGALVKLRTLETHPFILERYAIIREAASEIGSPQIRQMGTVGGNLNLDTRCRYYNQSYFWRKCRPQCIKMGGNRCNALHGGRRCFAVFAGDLAPALIALGAKIKIQSVQGERAILLSDFYTGDGANPFITGPEEMLVYVEVPAAPRKSFGSYFKYRTRKSIDFPLSSVATMVELDGTEKICRRVKVVVGAVSSKPEEVRGIEKLLEGKSIQGSIVNEAADLAFRLAKPIPNMGSSTSYRRRMIKFFVEKAFKKALSEFTWE